VEWRIVADVVTAGTTSTVTIQDGDQPFRTVGTEGVPMYKWERGSWQPYIP
jgi:hypothetical protein